MTAATLSPAPTARPDVHIPIIIRGCGTCFGTGYVWGTEGLKPCPNGCPPPSNDTESSAAPCQGPVLAIGCLECMHDCGGTGCGCTCCCSYLPAVASTRPRGAR